MSECCLGPRYCNSCFLFFVCSFSTRTLNKNAVNIMMMMLVHLLSHAKDATTALVVLVLGAGVPLVGGGVPLVFVFSMVPPSPGRTSSM